MEIQPLQKKISSNHDSLLKMIEQANIEEILLEENLSGFNELMKYELITIQDGQVHLTENGKKAKLEGVQTVVERLRVETQPLKLAQPDPKSRMVYYLLFLLLLLIGLAVFTSLNI